MYRITEKKFLNSTVVRISVEAPLVAAKARPGQFIILRVDEEGERIPLTVAGYDRAAGTVTVIYQIVGATTRHLAALQAGDSLADFAGPLGRPTDLDGLKTVCLVGGGVGCAIALPIARALHEQGCAVHGIIGFRTKDLVILEDEFAACCDTLTVMTDDGSYGQKGNVCLPLAERLKSERYDEVITIGPIIMMKYVVQTVKPTGTPCTVSMNPIMIDGTGMCGGCRLTLNRNGRRESAFACVDGPDFNGYEVDFDEAMRRGGMYREFERRAYDKACHLLQKEESTHG